MTEKVTLKTLEARLSKFEEEVKRSIKDVAFEVGSIKGEIKQHLSTPDAHNPFKFAE